MVGIKFGTIVPKQYASECREVCDGRELQEILFVVIDKPYWAKDLIFLVTSHGEIGMQAWVDQYMGVAPGKGWCADLGGLLWV